MADTAKKGTKNIISKFNNFVIANARKLFNCLSYGSDDELSCSVIIVQFFVGE